MSMFTSMRPSDVRYSQDSINNFFDAKCVHWSDRIGDTLDDLYYGRTTVWFIPKITVVWIDGHWFSADNRRLWIFKQLEKLGKCEKIPVKIGFDISTEKFTTSNNGISIQLRDSPGGKCFRKLTKISSRSLSQPFITSRHVSRSTFDSNSGSAFPSQKRRLYNESQSSSVRSSHKQTKSEFDDGTYVPRSSPFQNFSNFSSYTTPHRSTSRSSEKPRETTDLSGNLNRTEGSFCWIVIILIISIIFVFFMCLL